MMGSNIYFLKEQYGKLSLNYPLYPFLFGALNFAFVSGHGDLEVPINFETARLLHQCVRNGLQDAGHAKYKQLKEGEYGN